MDKINPDKMTEEELRGFAKGVKATQNALLKVKDKGSSVINTVMSSLINKIMTGLLVLVLGAGVYWFVSKKTDEVLTSVKTEINNTVNSVKDTFDVHPIENTKEWFKHLWSENNETNKTEKEVNETDDNKSHWYNIFSSDKEVEMNASADKVEITEVIKVPVETETEVILVVEEDVSQDENKTGFIANAKKKMSGWKFWEKENNTTKE